MIARLLISPSLDARRAEISKTLASHIGSGNTNHPDILYFPFDTKQGIEQARKIKEHFSLKPYSARGRVVVSEDASQLTDEAQNALLKTLEELPEQGLFILASDSESKLLPTVVSRCQIVRLQGTAGPRRGGVQENYTEDIEKLLESVVEQRFEYVEKLKDRNEFLHSLVNYFHHHLSFHLKGVSLNFMKELLQAEEWQKQNVNMRGILEYLMLKMPKIS